MTKFHFHGPWRTRLASLLALAGIGLATQARHAAGRRLAPDWDADFETGLRFWRHQFTRALAQPDMNVGRQIFDSLITETDDVYDVEVVASENPKGRWHIPKTILSEATLFYCHGGGYAFHSAVSRRFAAMLAHHCGARLFALDYRLTPEHPHPAQAEDALAAWRSLGAATAPEKSIVIGDSAGGHMALMLLLALKRAGLPQPALCIALCPWTDIGARGASFDGNDRTDLVQGWMARQFGRWLDPENRFGRAALSPIDHDFSGLAPLYLQAGGREILRDMIVDFARAQAARGANVLLDLWPDMPHEFQAYDRLRGSSTEALARIRAAVQAAVDRRGDFGPGPNSVNLAG